MYPRASKFGPAFEQELKVQNERASRFSGNSTVFNRYLGEVPLNFQEIRKRSSDSLSKTSVEKEIEISPSNNNSSRFTERESNGLNVPTQSVEKTTFPQ